MRLSIYISRLLFLVPAWSKIEGSCRRNASCNSDRNLYPRPLCALSRPYEKSFPRKEKLLANRM